jgi:hypothetical protein
MRMATAASCKLLVTAYQALVSYPRRPTSKPANSIYLCVELNSHWPVTESAQIQTTAIRHHRTKQTKATTKETTEQSKMDQLRLFTLKYDLLKISVDLQTAFAAEIIIIIRVIILILVVVVVVVMMMMMMIIIIIIIKKVCGSGRRNIQYTINGLKSQH